MSNEFSHLDVHGNANMVDISAKAVTAREATAVGYVSMQASTLQKVASQDIAKGDVFAVARIAGIQAAKKCSDLIPLCHPLALSKVQVDFVIEAHQQRIRIESLCKLNARTGVEMEALTAVSVAALTLFDMCKAIDPGMTIDGIKVLSKAGGKRGEWRMEDDHD
ncbi:cyclic pyranopterin monophosphate synthase MoaC [Aestuariibacter salexigens]|uniref:cyclic pyranopterin monophosphate synthase MoaC n=1 Tax=Aestuariibacter salexigens TaxID=226010 RepID=UPI00047AA592|nr:cyclic pyranopterin monophosphate synthase MoaC [Aestuariibacter salexigens]